VGARLSETELQKSLDFCVNLFNPTTPEQHEVLAKGSEIGKELLDVSAPLVNPQVLESGLRVEQKSNGNGANMSDSGEDSDIEPASDPEKASDVKMVLDKVNARRLMHPEYEINNVESEPLGGYVVRLARGQLGLVKA
jgi:hypothetical protein